MFLFVSGIGLIHWKSNTLVLQKLVDFSKSWPVIRLPGPALHHQVKHFLGAHRRWRSGRQEVEPVRVEPVLQVLNQLIFAQIGQGLLGAEGEHLPNGDAKRPDVTLGWPQPLQKSKQSISHVSKRCKLPNLLHNLLRKWSVLLIRKNSVYPPMVKLMHTCAENCANGNQA